MSTHRFFQGVILLSVVGLVGTRARGEPALLIEIHHVGSNSNISFVGQPLHMAFIARIAPGMNSVELDGTYDVDDVGMTFHATPEVVDAIEFALSQPTGRFALDISSFAPGSHPVDELWQTDWNPKLSDIAIRQFVPRIGLGLSGYDLTAVTQTVDKIEYLMSGRQIHSFQEQTIRFYGEVIPEPSSMMLILVHGLVCCAAYGRYRSVRGFIN